MGMGKTWIKREPSAEAARRLGAASPAGGAPGCSGPLPVTGAGRWAAPAAPRRASLCPREPGAPPGRAFPRAGLASPAAAPGHAAAGRPGLDRCLRRLPDGRGAPAMLLAGCGQAAARVLPAPVRSRRGPVADPGVGQVKPRATKSRPLGLQLLSLHGTDRRQRPPPREPVGPPRVSSTRSPDRAQRRPRRLNRTRAADGGLNLFRSGPDARNQRNEKSS